MASFPCDIYVPVSVTIERTTMGAENDAFLTTAVTAARRAGKIILENLGSLSKDDVGLKQASDFVTRADRESEEVIMGAVREQFPHHRFLAEESVKDIESEEYRWIIDPLDGITNYIHGFPVKKVLAGLIDR
jgi:myo-inositol-1(or 4)-monophosphatase